MTGLATYELDGSIATIVLDDGKVNALSAQMLQEIHAALDQAERDHAVVVLTGRENFLSAGFDLKVFAGGDPERVLEMLSLGAGLTERMLAFPTPIVVACPGHAVAAGSFLLLAADLRIGVEGPFQMGLNEVKIGITVPTFAIELARQRLHPAHFDRAVVSATMYGPADAVVAGFLDRALPAEELREASHQAAVELAALNLQAHLATKLRARAGSLQAIRAAIADELTIESLIAQAA
jgi:enoyl-CoA hydratase